jgi:hypothetical protein
MMIFQLNKIYQALAKAIVNFIFVEISFKWMNIDGCELKKNVKVLLKIIIFI